MGNCIPEFIAQRVEFTKSVSGPLRRACWSPLPMAAEFPMLFLHLEAADAPIDNRGGQLPSVWPTDAPIDSMTLPAVLAAARSATPCRA